jgi:hypothetical protein
MYLKYILKIKSIKNKMKIKKILLQKSFSDHFSTEHEYIQV